MLEIFKNVRIIVAVELDGITSIWPIYVQICLQINNAGVYFNLGSSNSVEFAQIA